VANNPRRRWFYRIKGTNEARLISSDHLVSIDVTAPVDWYDDDNINIKNASLDFVKQ
jgi:hypothetical protein